MALASPDRGDETPVDHGWTETETYRLPKEWITNWFEEPKPPNRPPGLAKPPWLSGVLSNTLFAGRK